MDRDLQLSIENFKEIFNFEKLKARQLYCLLNILDNKNEFPNIKKIAEELAKEDSNKEEQEIILEPFIDYIFSLNNEIKNELSRFYIISQNKKKLEKYYISKRKEIKIINFEHFVKKLLPLKNGSLLLIQIEDSLFIFNSYSFQLIICINMPSKHIFELKNKNLLIENSDLKILDKNKYSIYKEINSPGEFYDILVLSNGNILYFYKNRINGNYYDFNCQVQKERIKLKLFNSNLEIISSKKEDYKLFSYAFQVNKNYYALLYDNINIDFYLIENNEMIKSFDLPVNSCCKYDNEILFLFSNKAIFILNINKFEIIQKIKDIDIFGFYFLLNKEYIILRENDLNVCGYFICTIDKEFHFVKNENDSLNNDNFKYPIHLQKDKIAFFISDTFQIKII